MPVLLPSTYLGNIQFFSKFLLNEPVIIEQFDSYQKQTFRNRATILAANGPLNLTIPVVKASNKKTLVKEVRIDYDTKWQANHWRSILSAYNKTPFLEYYIDDLAPFYEQRYEFLIDFNTELMNTLLENLEIEPNYTLSNDFIPFENNQLDFRNIISPKNKTVADHRFTAQKYTQVFESKFGFVENLSVLDLLFHCGPEASIILEESICSL